MFIPQIISAAVIRSLAQNCETGSSSFFHVLANIHQVLEQKKNEISNFKELMFIFPRVLDKLLLKDHQDLVRFTNYYHYFPFHIF